jgi:hypothetical protein
MTAMITSHSIPSSIADLNTNSFPMNPAVVGMPVSEIKQIPIIKAKTGTRFIMPEKSLIYSSFN